MSEIIRFYKIGRGEKPLVPEKELSPLDTISEPTRTLMRPPTPGTELWDGLLLKGEKRSDAGPYLLPPLRGKHVEDPNYPTDDPTVPPKHRRT